MDGVQAQHIREGRCGSVCGLVSRVLRIVILFPEFNSCTVAVIGLGYVGLPLAVEFATPQLCRRTGAALHRRVIGFDIRCQRLEELRQGLDLTNETSAEELHAAQLLELTSDPAFLAAADVFVVTVPTPIDSAKRPDLTPLEKASTTVGQAAARRSGHKHHAVGDLQSTVFPGAGRGMRADPERESGPFQCSFPGVGLVCGYSPERINPGDTEHKLTTITKVTMEAHLKRRRGWMTFMAYYSRRHLQSH